MSSEGDKVDVVLKEEPVTEMENPSPEQENVDAKPPVVYEAPKEMPRPAGPVCQIEECSRALVNSYDKKCRTCHIHRNSLEVNFRGAIQRFCQKCCRFHELVEFDGVKKNCRHRLAEHNTRQRRMRMLRRTNRIQPQAHYAMPMHYDPMQQHQMMNPYHHHAMPPVPVFGGSLPPPPLWGAAPLPMHAPAPPPPMNPDLLSVQNLLDRFRGAEPIEMKLVEALNTILGSLIAKGPSMNGGDPGYGGYGGGAPPPVAYVPPPEWNGGGYGAGPSHPHAVDPLPPPPPPSAHSALASLAAVAAAAEQENGRAAAAAAPQPPQPPPQALQQQNGGGMSQRELEDFMWLEQALTAAAGPDAAKALEGAASLIPLLNMHAGQR